MRRAIAMIAACLWGAQAVAADVPSTSPGQGRQIVFVVQANGPHRAVDEHVDRHLRERGYRVRVEDQQVSPEAGRGADLVIISSTVSAKDLPAGWRQLPVPLLTWENDVLDDLAMTGKRHDVDFGNAPKERYLWIVNAPHPMADGVPAGVANVYQAQAPMSWGKPGLGASIIATVYGEPDKAAIFGYEKGATMDHESLAPARRAMVFLDNQTFSNLSPVGLRLFDAAVDWTAAAR